MKFHVPLWIFRVYLEPENQKLEGKKQAAYEMADVADDAYPSGKMANKIIQDLQSANRSGKVLSLRQASQSRTCLLMHQKNIGIYMIVMHWHSQTILMPRASTASGDA